MVSVPPLSEADSQFSPLGVITTGVAVTVRVPGLMVTATFWLAGAVPLIE